MARSLTPVPDAPERTVEPKRVYNHISKYAKGVWSTAWFELFQTVALLMLCFWLNKWWLSIFHGLVFLRLFIQFHDMAHLSFFPSLAWNTKLGTALGGPVLTPFGYWKHHHDHHHQHSNDLDYLQTSQTCPLTLREYKKLAPKQQRLYSLFTSRPMMLSVTPILIWAFFITRYRRHDVGYFLAYAVIGTLMGRGTIMFLSAWVGAVCGTYLFHMQHTFMPTTRISGKDYFENGLYSSSIVEIPWFLKWFTCGIEYHHIHHLNAKVPSYRTRACHEAAEKDMFKDVARLPLSYGFGMLRHNVWDEDGQCFRHAE